MTAFLSPVFGAGAQLFDNSGKVLAGGKIYTYLAQSSTPAATYIDSTAGITNANPIVLDASGRLAQEIWLPSGSAYRFAVTDSVGNSIGYVYDYITGVNDANYPQSSVNEWLTGSTPTYVGPTQFSVPGNQISTYVAGRRVKCSITAGLAYGSVVTSSYAVGVTTVTVVNDSTALDSGLSILQYGLISGAPSSIPTTIVTAAALQNQTATSGTTTGGSAAFTLTLTPALTAYATGQAFDVRFHTAAAAGATINVNGLGAIDLVRADAAGTYSNILLGDITTGWASNVLLISPTQAWVRQVVTTANTVSPVFTGDPRAPTPTAGDSDTSIATTAFVATAVSTAVSTYAPLASPTFTGDPKAPTPTAGDNDTSIATTAFVTDAISTASSALQTNINAKAPLVSPALTGTPTAPTAASGTNDTTIATTAFATQLAFATALPAQPGGTQPYALVSLGGTASWSSGLTPDFLLMAQGVI